MYVNNFDNLQNYLQSRFNSNGWKGSIAYINNITGLWQSSGNNFLASVNGQATTDLAIGNKLSFNGQACEVVQIVNDNLIKVDKIFSVVLSQTIQKLDESNYLLLVEHNTKQLSAYQTSNTFIKYSGVWNIPEPEPIKACLGIFEYTFWLFTTNGNNEAIKDLNNGIIQKKIDVLSWTYDKDLVGSMIQGSPESISYLREFETGLTGNIGGSFLI